MTELNTDYNTTELFDSELSDEDLSDEQLEGMSGGHHDGPIGPFPYW
jgi:hypothetical protein